MPSPAPRFWLHRLLEPRQALLAKRSTQGWLVLVSVLCCCTALGIGLELDDHFQHWVVTHPDSAGPIWQQPRHPLDLFRFVDGTPGDLARGYETGAAPWFTSPELRMAFARPISAVTHVVDYRLMAGAPWLMHVHSLLWLALLGVAVCRVARRLEQGPLLGLMLWFYLLDPSRGMPSGWLSNRNQLIAGCLGALAFELYLRWRQAPNPSLKLGGASALVGGMSLLAGESAVAWFGFYLAFALLLEPQGWRRGLASLLPLTAVVVCWRLVYRSLGYGTTHSGLYVDPLNEPLHFLQVTLVRWPQLIAGQLGGAPAGITALGSDSAKLGILALSVALLVLIGWALAPTLRSSRRACFWLLSAVFGAIPMCAMQPHPRLMLVVSLGTAGVAAHLVHQVVLNLEQRRVARVMAGLWLVVLGFVAPPRLAVEAWSISAIGRPSRLAADSFPADAVGRTLVAVTMPDPMFMCAQVSLKLASQGAPHPAKVRCLVGVEGEARVRRVDDHTLEIHTPAGLMNTVFAPLMRSEPFPDDWRLELTDSSYRIAERDAAGRPLTLSVRFHKPLDDPGLVFVAWSPTDLAFKRLVLPRLGETLVVPGQFVGDLIAGAKPGAR